MPNLKKYCYQLNSLSRRKGRSDKDRHTVIAIEMRMTHSGYLFAYLNFRATEDHHVLLIFGYHLNRIFYVVSFNTTSTTSV